MTDHPTKSLPERLQNIASHVESIWPSTEATACAIGLAGIADEVWAIEDTLTKMRAAHDHQCARAVFAERKLAAFTDRAHALLEAIAEEEGNRDGEYILPPDTGCIVCTVGTADRGTLCARHALARMVTGR